MTDKVEVTKLERGVSDSKGNRDRRVLLCYDGCLRVVSQSVNSALYRDRKSMRKTISNQYSTSKENDTQIC